MTKHPFKHLHMMDMDHVHSFPTFSNGWPPSLNCADPRTDRSPIFSHCRLTFPELPSSMDLEFKTGSQNISKHWVRVILDQILPGCSVNHVSTVCFNRVVQQCVNCVSLWEGGSPRIRPWDDVAYSGSAIIELIMYKRVPAVQKVGKRDPDSD